MVAVTRRRLTVPWVAVAARARDHPRHRAHDDLAAFGLWVDLLGYSHEHRLDGVIPASYCRTPAEKRALARLVGAGSVEQNPDGTLRLHDYGDWQQTADEIEALRQRRAASGSAGGLAKASKRLASATDSASKPVALAKQKPSNGLANPYQTGSKPVAEEKEEEKELTTKNLTHRPSADAPPTAQTIIADWLDAQPEPKPLRTIVSRISTTLKACLGDGVSPEHVTEGLTRWGRSGYGPGSLVGFIDAAHRGVIPQLQNHRPETASSVLDSIEARLGAEHHESA